ncbi:MAG: glycosyltransferase [Planctomycetaceae bacterium]
MQSNVSQRKASIGSRLSLALAGRIESGNIRHSTTIQCYSEFTRGVLSNRYPQAIGDRATVCPGWIDEQRFLKLDRQDSKRHLPNEWQTSKPVFFTLRRLEQRMGIETLLEAAQLLNQNGTSFRLLIGGDGSLRPQFQQQVVESGLDECVRFLGRVPEEDVPLCYAAADCFVLPTRALECFGIIILEAYAAGTPVIATRVAAIPEIVEHAGKEWLVEPGAPRELAEKMRLVAAGTLSIASEHLRKIVEQYRSTRTLQRLESLCSD